MKHLPGGFLFLVSGVCTLLLAASGLVGGSGTTIAGVNADCRQVPIEVLQADPVPFDGQIICTEGLIRVQYEGMALYPEGIDFEDLYRVRIFPPIGIDAARAWPLYNGDQIAVKGLFRIDRPCYEGRNPEFPNDEPFFCMPVNLPVWFENAEMHVLEQIPPAERCERVNIEDLYSDPLRFQNRMICTTGVMQDMPDTLAIVPAALYQADQGGALMELSSYHQLSVQDVYDGRQVRAVGWFWVQARCLEEEGLRRPCRPIAVPMILYLYELEYIE